MKPFICLIHGAGGGAWEYDLFWKECFIEQGFVNWNSIDLIPNNNVYQSTEFDHYVAQIRDFVAARIELNQDVILVGASMGAVLALHVSSVLKPKAIVLVCPTLPLEAKIQIPVPVEQKVYPSLIEWAGGTLQDTVDAMPDADMETCKYAASRWRNESGSVLNQITIYGVSCEKPSCPSLVVIPESDTSIPPSSQHLLAKYLNSEVLSYPGMSHVGPLLSTKAKLVATSVATWIKSVL